MGSVRGLAGSRFFLLRAAERARSAAGQFPRRSITCACIRVDSRDGRVKPRAFEAGRRAVAEAFEAGGAAREVVQPEWSLLDGIATSNRDARRRALCGCRW